MAFEQGVRGAEFGEDLVVGHHFGRGIRLRGEALQHPRSDAA